MCHDFDYPGDDCDISPGTLAIKANHHMTWDAAEAFSENGIQSARLFAKVAQENMKQHMLTIHICVLNFMDTHKTIVDKKVNKMLVQAQGLENYSGGGGSKRASHGLRVIDVDEKTEWPSFLSAEPLCHMMLRICEEGSLQV